MNSTFVFELQHEQLQLNLPLAATEKVFQLRVRIYDLMARLGVVGCTIFCIRRKKRLKKKALLA
jgi:hypothetical protein